MSVVGSVFMNSKQWVVVSGASGGIGHATVEVLRGAGFGVFAMARSERNGDALREKFGPCVEPLVCDVTMGATIQQAVLAVEKKLGEQAAEVLRALEVPGAETLLASYGADFRNFLEVTAAMERGGSDPHVVARIVLRALKDRRPRTRYLAGRHASLLATLARLPDGLLDLIRKRLFRMEPRP